MDTCYKLSKSAEKSGMDLRVIGVPKTIDFCSWRSWQSS